MASNDHGYINDKDYENWYTEAYSIVVPMMICMCLLGFVLNVFVLFLMRWMKRPLFRSTSFTLGLAAADAWASACFGTGYVVNTYVPIVMDVKAPNIFCISLTMEGLRLGALVTSVLFLTLLASTHYNSTRVSVNQPRRSSPKTNRTTIITIIACFILPSLSFLLLFTIVPDQAYRSEDCDRIDFLQDYIFRLVVVLSISIPFLLVILLYLRMFYQLWIGQRKPMGQMLTAPPGSSFHRRQARRRRTVVTSLILIGSFFLSWGPVCTAYLVLCPECEIFEVVESHPKLSLILNTIANAMTILKFCYNPLLYAVRIPAIRTALMQVFWKTRLRRTFSSISASISDRSSPRVPTINLVTFDGNSMYGSATKI